VPRDGIGHQPRHLLFAFPRGHVFEGAHPQVARRHAREHRAGQHLLAHHGVAGRHDRQRSRRRDARRVHPFRNQHLPQHRPHGGLAVAAPRERRAARTLERDVAPQASGVDHLTQQQRAPVTQPRRPSAELVARVHLREGLGALGYDVSGKYRGPGLGIHRVGRQAQLGRQRVVEVQQLRRRSGRRAPRDAQFGKIPGVGVVERKGDAKVHGGAVVAMKREG